MDISHQISNQFETKQKKLRATQTKELPDDRKEEDSTRGE